jgi:hypothetical protein
MNERLPGKQMTTVAILPLSDASGERIYRALAGDKQSIGRTAGEALDALANVPICRLFEYLTTSSSFNFAIAA